ncbi:MAG TPA: PhoU domain-containing protein [Acidimicrobiales bacterium]|nr:PhoU domain-containing protein [Acidimicrobiales bacterium]
MPSPLRTVFHDELDQLRLQVEVMGIRVDQNLERLRRALREGDEQLVGEALAADDEIDDMHLSLLERCYGLLNREAPVASDLRFVLSAVRILSEFERIGDLALRGIKLAPQADDLAATGAAWDLVLTLVDVAVEQYRTALRAWSAQDLGLATDLATNRPSFASYHERMIVEMRHFEGPEAVPLAMAVYAAGHAADRIADHAAIIGARLRYLITGEAAHLAAEVR